MNTAEAHRQLIVLLLEVGLVLGLGMVAEASPNWGAPALVLVLILWTAYLMQHSESLTGLLGGRAPAAGPVAGGGGGSLTP